MKPLRPLMGLSEVKNLKIEFQYNKNMLEIYLRMVNQYDVKTTFTCEKFDYICACYAYNAMND